MITRILKRTVSPGAYADIRTALLTTKACLASLARAGAARRTLADVQGTELLLHLGCGRLPREGWVNADMFPPPGAYYVDLRNPLALADGSVRHIHCEHVLEHLNFDDALMFLSECHRVLAPGGTLRLIMPDAEKYIRAYCADDRKFFQKMEYLGNAKHPMKLKSEVINQMFRMGGDHRYAWDFETLKEYLGKAGFVRIERSEFGGIQENLRIDGTDEWRALESVYLNATKG